MSVEVLAKWVAPDKAIRLNGDIHDRRPRMVGELLQRSIDSRCFAAVCAGLLEGRQHHGSARALKRISKCLVCRRVGRRAEIDVEYDVPNISDFQPPQQVGMEAAWPWPDSDFLDRGSIDRNNDNVAGGLTRHPGEPQIGQCIAEHAVPAGRQHDGERNHDKDMRSVMFQVVPIP